MYRIELSVCGEKGHQGMCQDRVERVCVCVCVVPGNVFFIFKVHEKTLNQTKIYKN